MMSNVKNKQARHGANEESKLTYDGQPHSQAAYSAGATPDQTKPQGVGGRATAKPQRHINTYCKILLMSSGAPLGAALQKHAANFNVYVCRSPVRCRMYAFLRVPEALGRQRASGAQKYAVKYIF